MCRRVMISILDEIEAVSLEPGDSVDIEYEGVTVSLSYEVKHQELPFMPTFQNIRAIRRDSSETTTVDYSIWRDEKALAIDMILDRLFGDFSE